jgi:hypothetical protein
MTYSIFSEAQAKKLRYGALRRILTFIFYDLVFSSTKSLSDRCTDTIGICAIASVAKA